MQPILELLNNSPIVKTYEVLELIEKYDSFSIKIKAFLEDNSLLFIRESITENSPLKKCSYQWQTLEGQLITRWDNAPHHNDIKTHPHHKHTPILEESYPVDIEDILNEIKRILKKK